MNPIERTSHPSTAQVETLVELLEQNPSLAKGFSKTQSARNRSQRDWDRITLKLNSIGGGTIKTSKKWMKYWSDKKSAVKKKAAARAAARHRTGGGVDFAVPELSVIEERIIAVMGGEGFATGDRHLQIQPFDEPMPQQNDSPSLLLQIPSEDVPLSPLHAQRASISPAHEIMDGNQGSAVPGPSSATITLWSEPMVTERSEVSCPVESPRPRPSRSINDSPTPGPSRLPEAPRTPRTRLTASASSPRRRRLRTVQLSPPSQRRSQFISIAEKFLRIEEQRLAIHQQIANTLDRNAEREVMMVEATKVLGEGLKALAEAIKDLKR